MLVSRRVRMVEAEDRGNEASGCKFICRPFG
jgi:hypothetical protein